MGESKSGGRGRDGARPKLMGECSAVPFVSCIPLQLALRRFVGAAGWVQHLGRVGHGQQSASFVMALAQG